MAENTIIPTTMFGNYAVDGELVFLASCTQKNVASKLYYNQSNRTYFLVKEYASGKYHIDFFNRTRRHDLDYIFNPDNRSFKMIAYYCSKDNSVEKDLVYCNHKKTFVIHTLQDNVRYRLVLAKNSLFVNDIFDTQE